MEPLEPIPSLMEATADRIRRAIILGELPLGSKLSEQKLADMLGVSRSPVHNALALLQYEGLVEVQPKVGSFVFTPSLKVAFDLCDHRAVLEQSHAAILELTKANWIGVREWDGQDLLYFTHLQVYRCAMDQIRYFVNVGKPRVREMEPCYDDLPTPYIMKAPEGHLPYDRHELNSIQTITVEITLKDGSVLKETFERGQVMIP